MSYQKRQPQYFLIGFLMFFGIFATMILTPIFRAAQPAPKRSQLMHSAKKQGTAILIYSADYDERYPAANFNENYLGAFPVKKGAGFGIENQLLLPDLILEYMSRTDDISDSIHEIKLIWDHKLKKVFGGGARNTGGWNYLCPATDPEKVSPASKNPLRALAEGRLSDAELAGRFVCGRKEADLLDRIPVLMLDSMWIDDEPNKDWQKNCLPAQYGGTTDGRRIGTRLYCFADSSAKSRQGTFEDFLKELRLDR